jgi:sulfoxide reductase heme-binding subunit YedZ
MKPWTDRSGRLSYLKLAALAGALAPGAWIAGQLATGQLGPLPIEAVNDATGRWAIRLLLLSLLVTPVQRIGNWPRLILVRRMLGIATLAYAAVHFCAFALNQNLDLTRIVSEISQRLYLAIGLAGLTGLLVLGATSFDRVIRWMGYRWKILHRAVYLIAALGIVHFFLQAKIDATEPTLMAGFFILLMGYRLAIAMRVRLSPLVVALTGLAASAATAAAEYAWYGLATGVDPLAVLEANLAFPQSIRPAAVVLGAGIVMTAISAARSLRERKDGVSVNRRFARAARV